MARLIQMTIKTPLADEVLFGKLKDGGTVKVVVKTDDIGLQSLGFEFLEGPTKPKPEKDVVKAARRRAKPKTSTSPKAKKTSKPKGTGGNGGGSIRTVPKVPLVRA